FFSRKRFGKNCRELRISRMVLGPSCDSGGRDFVRTSRTTRGREIARIRCAETAAATFGNCEPFAACFAIRISDAWTCARGRESGAAAGRLYIPGCEMQRTRHAFRGRYFAKHAFERRAAEPARARQTRRPGSC